MRKLFTGYVLIMAALVATAVGDVVVFKESVGIAQTAGDKGDDISVDTVGVYEFVAEHDDEINVGDILYWKADDKEVTTDSDSGNNVRVGTSWGTKPANTDGNVGVKIG